MVPHHPSNRLGHRGSDASKFDPEVSPLLEIHSEWGCAEHDRAPHPYKRQFKSLEERARKQGVGLWADVKVERMPEWRRRMESRAE